MLEMYMITPHHVQIIPKEYLVISLCNLAKFPYIDVCKSTSQCTMTSKNLSFEISFLKLNI